MSDSDSLISSSASDADNSFKIVSYLSVSEEETWSERKKKNSKSSHSSSTTSLHKSIHSVTYGEGSPSKRRNQLEFKHDKNSPKTVKLLIEEVSPHMQKNTTKKIPDDIASNERYDFPICSRGGKGSFIENPTYSDGENERVFYGEQRIRQKYEHNKNSTKTTKPSIDVLSSKMSNNSKKPIMSSPISKRTRRQSEDINNSDDAETKLSTQPNENSKRIKKSKIIRSRTNSTNENDALSENESSCKTDEGEKENDHDQVQNVLLLTPTKTTPPRKLRQRTPSIKSLESFLVDAEDISPQTTTRRSARKISQNRRYSYFREIQRKREETALIDIQEEEDAKEALTSPIEKSTTLYLENEDVAGHNLYSFRTPKKRGGMALVAANTPKSNRKLTDTPKTPKTPKSSRNSNASCSIAKTPKQVRSLVKKSEFF